MAAVDPSTLMELTEEEKGWALAIQNKLNMDDPSFAKKVADFEYAHHAIVAKDNVDKALTRIRRLDAFKEEYEIPSKPTVKEAMECINKFNLLAPGFFTSFGIDENDGRHVLSGDYKAFLPDSVNSKADWKNMFAALFYIMEAMQPNIGAIRSGVVWLFECEGLGWKNFSIEMQKRAVVLFKDSYPLRIKELSQLNASILMRVIYNVCKPFLSLRVKEVCHLDAKLPDIQERFPKDVLPTTMGGAMSELDMLAKIEESLKERYGNSESFEL
jgi:hypothetical protein